MIIDRLTGACDAAGQLAIELALFDAMAPAAQRLRLWQSFPALVVTRAEAGHPHFAAAAVRAEGRGLPVSVRPTGGGAVSLGPGSLVVSHLYTSRRNNIDDCYGRFSASLRDAVADLDVPLTQEQVAGAYCDGRFDLAWNGRKVGGMAQRRRVRDSYTQVWIHAVLAVDAASQRHAEAVRQFYADLGSSRVADPHRTTTIASCLPAHIVANDLVARMGDSIVRAFGACSGDDSPA